MDLVTEFAIVPLRDFAKDSIRLLNKCTKPDRKGTFAASTACTSRPRPASSRRRLCTSDGIQSNQQSAREGPASRRGGTAAVCPGSSPVSPA